MFDHKMIEKEQIDDLGYLNVERTRDKFLTNKFNKSKSTSTVSFCKGALHSFDKFVFAKFGKNSTEQVIEDIKKLPESRHESIVIELFQKYLHWKHEESKASTSVAYYQTAVEYFAYHQLKINHYNLRRGITLPQDPKNMKYAVTYSEIKKLIDYSHPYVDFLNLNELEVADNQQSKLIELGFETKDDFSYAVKGSLELGKELIQYVQEKEYPLAVHICTAKLKDATQLSNRIKRQAQGAKLPFDIVDEEGMLTRGALYLEELSPGAGYREKLKEDHEEIIERLKELQQEVKKLNIKTVFDEKKPRILISKSDAKKHVKKFKKLNLKPAIVTEYPTYDQLEVEVEFL